MLLSELDILGNEAEKVCFVSVAQTCDDSRSMRNVLGTDTWIL